MSSTERESKAAPPPEPPKLSPEEIALREARNGLHQFDRLAQLVEEATKPGARFRLRPSTIMDLNRYAVDGLMAAPGSFRRGPVTITYASHTPPPPEDVPRFVEEMCEYVEDNWTKSAVHLAGYVLWRLNWIHPFRDGNGRTARAVSYLVLAARLGYRLPGTTTIPERIAATKASYYTALERADEAWKKSEVDVSKMEELLTEHLTGQLMGVVAAATSSSAAAGSTDLQSTYISYGQPDKAFADKLAKALERSGVKTFLFPDDGVPGQPLHEMMRKGVNEHDRVILVCSKAALDRKGVLNEIEETLRREARSGGVPYLIPIRLDDYVLSGWNPPGTTAQAVRDRVVADFQGALTDPVKFDAALNRLLAALRRP
ncbi:MAG TPA: TIR domain-containing protein [Polyangia bacterium]|jgi:Uncharacterized conserved protein|nr:TIR domain-containing protein [Polyangia bacterium]